jgi:hypothetical protein
MNKDGFRHMSARGFQQVERAIRIHVEVVKSP